MIKNTLQLIKNGRTLRQQKVRRDLCMILENVLKAIDPFFLVKQNLEFKGNILRVAHKLTLDLSRYEKIYVVGGGKAVYKMALAVEELLQSKVTSGHINVPVLPSHNQLKKVRVWKARHPLPDFKGVIGTKHIKQILEKAGVNDLIIAVISGGGSALMPLPAKGITLKEKIKLTSLLLKTPATIHEINVIRKHLSQIKGGQFACLSYPATLVTLYISDIIDDPFDIQASGPTAPDPSTFKDAIRILEKYGLWNKTPKIIKKRLTQGAKGLIPETPKPNNKVFCQGKIYNFTIGNHRTAVEAARRAGQKLKYNILELTSSIQGEARQVAKVIIAIGKHIQQYHRPLAYPALVVAGGETTVLVRGQGKGGRNQELVLSAISQLREGMTMVSFGTDGVDGITPIPVAGAIADIATSKRALHKKLDIQNYLANNDSYHFFKTVREHIITGYSGTNVGDLILLAIY